MGLYHENLGMLLKAGYPINQANKLASKLTKKQKREKKEELRRDAKNLLKKYKIIR